MDNGGSVLRLIKELYKLEAEPVHDVRKIRLSLALAALAAGMIGFWRESFAPACAVSLLLALSFFKPAWVGRLLTAIKMGLAYLIHTINLLLLTVTYFVIVTPLGFALKLNRRESDSWRSEPTELPSAESFLRPY